MVIIVFGQDTFRSRRRLAEISERFQAQAGGVLVHLDFSRDSFEQFCQVSARPLFHQERLFILENVFSDSGLSKKILNFFQKDRPVKSDRFVFFEPEEVNRSNSLFRFLLARAKIEEFKILDQSLLKTWISKETKTWGGKISREAIDRLVVFLGGDLWALSGAIKTLVSFRGGDLIESQDVELLVRPQIEANIFQTLDALVAKKRETALRLISQHWQKGDSVFYLLSMLGWQFRNLLLVQDLGRRGKPLSFISRTLALRDFLVKKYWFLASCFDSVTLKKIYGRLLKTDLKIKTGHQSGRQAIELFFSQI